MTTMTTQAGVPILPLPEKSTNGSKQRTRTRSGSLLKVEQVGEASAERDLDQNLYVNINADWVNMKGGHNTPAVPARSQVHPLLLQALGSFTLYSSFAGRS
jgi:hypothetical protein